MIFVEFSYDIWLMQMSLTFSYIIWEKKILSFSDKMYGTCCSDMELLLMKVINNLMQMSLNFSILEIKFHLVTRCREPVVVTWSYY